MVWFDPFSLAGETDWWLTLECLFFNDGVQHHPYHEISPWNSKVACKNLKSTWDSRWPSFTPALLVVSFTRRKVQTRRA